MNRKKISIIEKILICSVGIVLTFDGVVGFFSFINTRNYIHTVGVVEELDRKKIVYNPRKIGYKKVMVIRYETDNHGTLYATLRSHYPFRKVGDELPLWYDPDEPKNIKLHFSDSISYILSIVIGVLIIYFGIFIVNKNR
ncbi:DUF3592 domain-containing protein [Brachyspira hyodysenteriae]|uniref:DUF3592 domain-containing protein n=1 Tax=Brachyspira hyodysenteriae TaxID=159 RepID=UPI002B25697B|nr:DUF3592 domain-containing protein [Brachyspira hyodysenteriae]WPC36870.1 DUF3592 domain-containing protein [Brachyspira hyodysenteriae]